MGAFFGAASLDTGSSQTGYYTGFSASLTNIGQSGLDAVLEFRHGDGLGRDVLFEGDPVITEHDFFLDFDALSVSVSYRF